MTDDPLAFLFSLERLGMKFGLGNISLLCESLGHPERRFRSVIVAGTNGKGSVTAMTDTALRAAGHRTGRYTSPHLLRLEERFVIAGTEVATAVLRGAAARVQQAVASLLARHAIEAPPTFFECTTAVAFELFSEAAVDIAVLEVGLGGRLDATNVVTPMAAVITSIDLDHQAQLGDTIDAIAEEKAGVIAPGIPVICGPLPDAAAAVIRRVCRERSALMVPAPDVVHITARMIGGHSVIDLRSSRRTLTDVRLALRGGHQISNAAVAVALLDELDLRHVGVSDHAVRVGLSETAWPGRLEWVRSEGAEILLDAAHNPAGARALASYLREIGWTDVALVFGAMEDKDIGGMLDALLPCCRAIVCTTPPTPRAAPAHELAAHAAAKAGSATRVEAVDDPVAALQRARQLSARIVAAGSIFLIGPLRVILR